MVLTIRSGIRHHIPPVPRIHARQFPISMTPVSVESFGRIRSGLISGALVKYLHMFTSELGFKCS